MLFMLLGNLSTFIFFSSFFVCLALFLCAIYRHRFVLSLPTDGDWMKNQKALLACWCVSLNIYSLWKSSNKNAASRLQLFSFYARNADLCSEAKGIIRARSVIFFMLMMQGKNS